MNERQSEFTVLGAGIAGLATAILLARSGGRVTIIERSTGLDGSGAGIQITPNGTRVLHALGLSEGIRKVGVKATGVEVVDHRTGRRMSEIDLSHYGRGGFPYMLFRREELMRLLEHAAGSAGVEFLRGRNVTCFEEDDGEVLCRFSGGGCHSAQFLIGADGLHSRARDLLNPDEPPLAATHIAWRAAIAAGSRAGAEAGRITLVPGPGRHLVVYRQGAGAPVNLVAVRRAERTFEYHSPRHENPQALMREFSDFGAGVRNMLKDVETVSRWALGSSGVAARWNSGRVAIIGDALHPVLPFLSQGGSMALEDAWVLAGELASQPDFGTALAKFRSVREARIRRVARATSLQGWVYHSRLSWPRRLAFSALDLGGRLSPRLASFPLRWIHEMDAVGRHSAADEVQASSSTKMGT